MLLTADWVLPVSRRPIERGGVLVHGRRVIAVGPAEELSSHPAAEDGTLAFEGCVIAPGLVNAHTHLSLTVLQGLIPPLDLPTWISRLVPAMRSLDDDDLAVSAAHGAVLSLRSGVTAVGDVTYGPEGLAAAADAGVGGTFFWEVLGIPASLLAEELASREYPAGSQERPSRERCALSAHSVYACGPHLIRSVARTAREQGAPFVMHVAESLWETELLFTGAGPLAGTSHRLATGFRPPRVSTVCYLQKLGVLEGITAIHCVHVSSADIRMLTACARGVVVCPRSNDYLSVGRAPVEKLLACGIPVGLGTDSAASVEDLDLFSEARLLHERHGIPHRRLVEMLTAEGAEAIGAEGHHGRLEEGGAADVIVVKTGPTGHPEEAFVREGGPGTVQAVLSGGMWRIMHGDTTLDQRETQTQVDEIAERVGKVLSQY